MTSFLHLPLEIRRMIYELHFRSTILFFNGQADITAPDLRKASSRDKKGNNLALLRTSKMTNAETKNSWMGVVLFKFKCARQLLDSLATLSRHKQKQIRHVEVTAERIRTRFDTRFYDLDDVIGFLRSLSLNELTVNAYSMRVGAYSFDQSDLLECIQTLIADWPRCRELKIITRSNLFRNRPVQQEAIKWRDALGHRDQEGSDTGLEIFRATKQEGGCTTVFDTNTREAIKLPTNATDLTYPQDDFTTTDGSLKAVLIVVRRKKLANVRKLQPLKYRVTETDTVKTRLGVDGDIGWDQILRAEEDIRQLKEQLDNRKKDWGLVLSRTLGH